MKRPFDIVRQMFLKNLARTRENSKFNFEQSDKFMVWIVGFSIGGLSLIATNLTQFSEAFNHNTIKAILILLAISIITGIVYRWFFFLYQVQYQTTEFYFEGAFSEEEFMEIEPNDLSNETDIKEVVRRLKDDYGEDLSYILEIYEAVDKERQNFLLEDLKKHYNKVGLWAKKEYEFAMDYAKDTYQKAFGLSHKRIDKLFNSNTPFKLKLYGWITSISFFISCATFIAVIIILCSKY